MKLIPKYSFEFNAVLSNLSGKKNIENYTSMITDRDRFLVLLERVMPILDFVEKYGGFKLVSELDFFIVRSEKNFRSFSEPITLNYSIFPEEMILFLFKEVVKVFFPINFFYDVEREQFINSFVKFVFSFSLEGEFKSVFEKYFGVLDVYSKELCLDYSVCEYDFSERSLVDYVSELYNLS